MPRHRRRRKRRGDLKQRLSQPSIWIGIVLTVAALGLIIGLTIHGMNEDRAGSDATQIADDGLEADFLSLGAAGISDSANPAGATSDDAPFMPDLNSLSEDDADAPGPVFADHEAAPTIVFEPAAVSSGPLFPGELAVGESSSFNASSNAGRVQPTEFQQPGGTIRPSVAANQPKTAAWLTGKIEFGEQ